MRQTLIQIEKEFDEEFNFMFKSETAIVYTSRKNIKTFLKSKINLVIDEMIGEEKKEGRIKLDEDVGYNQKVQELKEYKKKFLL